MNNLELWKYPLTEPRQLPVPVLAYIGDAVFELYVRLYLVHRGMGKMNELHKEASELVKAASQAQFFHRLEHILEEDETTMAKRGRNAKTGYVPKNAQVIDYRFSTGFETLLGYLFLEKKEKRIIELLEYLFNGDDKLKVEGENGTQKT